MWPGVKRSSLGFDGHARGPPSHVPLLDADKDAIVSGIEGYRAAPGDEDRKRRLGAGGGGRRDGRPGGVEAHARRVGLAERHGNRERDGAGVGGDRDGPGGADVGRGDHEEAAAGWTGNRATTVVVAGQGQGHDVWRRYGGGREQQRIQPDYDRRLRAGAREVELHVGWSERQRGSHRDDEGLEGASRDADRRGLQPDQLVGGRVGGLEAERGTRHAGDRGDLTDKGGFLLIAVDDRAEGRRGRGLLDRAAARQDGRDHLRQGTEDGIGWLPGRARRHGPSR